ncbi:MAG: hypothetical protein RL196_301 [Actinomycetota bacterium]|jgi:hypothetical protein
MLSNIQLENFQGFGEKVEVPLRPLTLIFGPNASGKSSIIRSLLLQEQSLGPRDFGPFGANGFIFEGPSISLASFANVVHKHDEDASIKMAFTTKVFAPRSNQTGYIENHLSSLSIEYTIGIQAPFSAIRFEAQGKNNEDPMVLEFEFLQRKGLVLRRLEGEELLSKLLSSSSTSFLVRRNAETESRESVNNAIEYLRSTLNSREDYSLRGNFPTVSGARSRSENADERERGAGLVDTLLNSFRLLTLREFRNVGHVGPLRKIEARLNYTGGLALDEEDFDSTDSRSRDGSVSEQIVSDWFYQLSGSRYRLKPVSFYAEKVRFLGSLEVQIVVDTLTDTPVTFSDVGVGLSQVLPVLRAIAPSTANGLLRAPRLALIEQPELHLHPKMQADLASLFAEIVSSNRGTQIIAETHSEAMLLRIQKKIRDGELEPNLVQILFVDKYEIATSDQSGETDDSKRGNRVLALDMDADDEFSVQLPLSFTKLRMSDLL